MKGDCIFCSIAKKEAPALVVFEDEHIMAFMDLDPISDGHILIIPKKHRKDIHAVDDETGGRIFSTARKIAGIIENEFGFQGSMIMEVNGIFQEVPHFHLHVFGRNRDNDIAFSYPPKTNPDPEAISRNARKIKEAIEKK